jgi:hypothetical protein
MNGTNSSATQKLCLISHLARFRADNGLPRSYASEQTFNDAGPKSGCQKFASDCGRITASRGYAPRGTLSIAGEKPPRGDRADQRGQDPISANPVPHQSLVRCPLTVQ